MKSADALIISIRRPVLNIRLLCVLNVAEEQAIIKRSALNIVKSRLVLNVGALLDINLGVHSIKRNLRAQNAVV